MRHRAGERQIEQAPGFDVRRRGASREARRARRQARGFQTVSAARSELGHHPARRRRDDARGLAGDRRLEREDREQRRLDDLRLHHRRRHAHERLVREDDLALVHGPDVARETKCRQYLVKEPDGRGRERGHGAEPGDLVGREAQAFEVVERLGQAGRHQVAAARGQLAHEELERARGRVPGRLVARHHRQLVEVGGERARHGQTHGDVER